MISISRMRFFLLFIIGFYSGLLVSIVLKYTRARNLSVSLPHFDKSKGGEPLFEQKLADQLFTDVKVLCMVMTNPSDHKTKAIHIKNTWGKRCNKLLFITTKSDPEFETIVLPLNESRRALRKKTKGSFLYAHEHHLNDFDWFLKADDDK